jgi:hypothetical protein
MRMRRRGKGKGLMHCSRIRRQARDLTAVSHQLHDCRAVLRQERWSPPSRAVRQTPSARQRSVQRIVRADADPNRLAATQSRKSPDMVPPYRLPTTCRVTTFATLLLRPKPFLFESTRSETALTNVEGRIEGEATTPLRQ